MSRTHTLKIWPNHFEEVAEGRKKAEIRKDDRGFAVGDLLHLVEFDPAKCIAVRETGRTMTVAITHILHGGRFGLDPDYVMLSIEPVSHDRE